MDKVTRTGLEHGNQGYPALSMSLNFLLALAGGMTIANLYYAQPIIAAIGSGIGLEPSATGLIVTVTQVGYCLGVLFIVPLADIVENRRLIITLTFGAATALLATGLSGGSTLFLSSIFLVGFCSSAAQIIIPYSVGMAQEHQRGRVIGIIVSGSMLGIVLSRPISGLLAQLFGWQWSFLFPFLAMSGLGCIFLRTLPAKPPAAAGVSYSAILASMVRMISTWRALQQRVFFQAAVFCGFTMFWTAVPLLLKNELHFTPSDIALFSMAGIAGPLSAPLAGRLADRGLSSLTSAICALLVMGAFLIPLAVGTTVGALVFAVFLLDSGATISVVLTQRMVTSLDPMARSRLNGLCITAMFCGGATGAFLGTWSYIRFGWQGIAMIGTGTATVALLTHVSGKPLSTGYSRTSP